jgi:acyl-CoA thioester hydrolase
MMSTGNETSPQRPGWNFCLPVEVRFRDVDMFGHVNNAAYLTYIESARVAYYAHLSGLKDPREFDILKPAFYGQTLHVYTRAGRIGNKSWTLEHEMRDSESGEVIARGSTVIVHFEHATQQSKPLPPEIVELIERHEGRSLRGR